MRKIKNKTSIRLIFQRIRTPHHQNFQNLLSNPKQLFKTPPNFPHHKYRKEKLIQKSAINSKIAHKKTKTLEKEETV